MHRSRYAFGALAHAGLHRCYVRQRTAAASGTLASFAAVDKESLQIRDIRILGKWFGSPPDNVYRAILAFARLQGGWYNIWVSRWEFRRPAGIDLLFAKMLAEAYSLAGQLQVRTPWREPLPDYTPSCLVTRFADPAEQELFEERAGIMEFEGNLARTYAEQRAFEEISSGRFSEPWP